MGVPQQLLDAADLHAAFRQVRGKAMAQCVHGELVGQSGEFAVFVKGILNCTVGDAIFFTLFCVEQIALGMIGAIFLPVLAQHIQIALR